VSEEYRNKNVTDIASKNENYVCQEEKLRTIQNSIDNLKVLFTQVLERFNIVNQENNFLRTLVMQNQVKGDTDFQVNLKSFKSGLDATDAADAKWYTK
jgi:hypothetical protein